MNRRELNKIKVGDRIRFRAATRWNCSPVWRVVNGTTQHGPTVRYGGWGDFYVRWDEISDHEVRDQAS